MEIQPSTPRSTPSTNMQTYTLTCSSKSLSDSDLKGNPLAYCYTDKVRVTPCTSFCTWQPRRNECQKTSADSSSSSYPHCECLCTGVQVGRHLKLQSDPFTCGPSEYCLRLNILHCCKLLLLQTDISSRTCMWELECRRMNMELETDDLTLFLIKAHHYLPEITALLTAVLRPDER